MNKNILVVLGVVVVVLAGWYFTKSNKDASTSGMDINGAMESDMEKEGSMMDKDDAMMEKNDSVVMEKEGTMMDKGTMMAKSGTFESYASSKVAMASSTHDVVLFFDASWCPTCKSLKKDINSNLSSIPASLTILDVDYDNSSDLKKKYGVTYQHTFVQVDKDGNLIKKWSGSPTLAALVKEVK